MKDKRMNKIKEIVIISGKGGTGKTSILSSFAALAENPVLADCDVDAADLHLILRPHVQTDNEFRAGNVALLDHDACIECGKCIELCRYDAISDEYEIDGLNCEGCGVCAWFCPVDAITMKEKVAGHWFVSDSDYGPVFHARLNYAEDNSGKLVSEVRQAARKFAESDGHELILVDGPPGVGCPVIASITGAQYVLIVTEPTVSGIHDMARVIELTAHFRIDTAVCINKYDLNEDKSAEIETFCAERNVPVIGKIPYDTDFTRAMIESMSVVEYSDGEASSEIRKLWEKLRNSVNV